MAAQYTEITLEEMDTFLKRSFRALRPKQFTKSGAVYYDLTLGPNVAVRIWTTIGTWGSTKGEKSMKVQLYGPKVNRRLVHEEAVRMKRTQNWRSTLQDNIEEFLELYESKPEYWEQNASGDHKQVEPERDEGEREKPEQVEERRPPPRSGPPASDKQINYILSMAPRATRDQLIHLNLKYPVDAQEIRDLSLKEASALIGALINYGLNRRYSSEDQPSTDLDIRSAIRQEVMRSLQADSIESRIACEGGCDKSEGTCGGDCNCSKESSPVGVAQVATAPKGYEDPLIASILDDLLV